MPGLELSSSQHPRNVILSVPSLDSQHGWDLRMPSSWCPSAVVHRVHGASKYRWRMLCNIKGLPDSATHLADLAATISATASYQMLNAEQHTKTCSLNIACNSQEDISIDSDIFYNSGQGYIHSPHRFPTFFFDATTLKLPLLSSGLPASFVGPFLATSLQPPAVLLPALCGLVLLGGAEVSTSPLSASFRLRTNSSAKRCELMVLLLPCTASVMRSRSGPKEMSVATKSSTVIC